MELARKRQAEDTRPLWLRQAEDETRTKASDLARRHGLNQTDETSAIFSILADATFYLLTLPWEPMPIRVSLTSILQRRDFPPLLAAETRVLRHSSLAESFVNEALEHWGNSNETLKKIATKRAPRSEQNRFPEWIYREFEYFQELKSRESMLLSRDDLRSALFEFTEYINDETNRKSIIHHGTPSLEHRSQSEWLTSRLADLYPDEGILSASEARRVTEMRRSLLTLKTAVLTKAAEALALPDPTPETFWSILRAALSAAPKDEEARVLFAFDRAYLGLNFVSGRESGRVGHSYPGGLTNMLDLLFHVGRELFLTSDTMPVFHAGSLLASYEDVRASWRDVSYSRLARALGSMIRRVDRNPQFTCRSYFQLSPHELQILRDLMAKRFPVLFPGQERPFWSEFVYRCHAELGLDTRYIDRELLTHQPDHAVRALVYNSAESVMNEISSSEFAFTPSFHWVLYRGNQLFLKTGERGGIGEADIVRVLYKTSRGKWISERELRKLLTITYRDQDLEEFELREKLDSRVKVDGKRARVPGDAERHHLISLDTSRKPVRIRLNV